MRKTWTEKEVDFIKNNLSKMDLKTMANVLNVNYLKLIDKIHKLGLNSKKEKGILWTEQEDVLLKKHFEFAPKNYLLKLFPNRTWNSIFQRGCKKYNLKRKSQDRLFIKYDFFEKWNKENAYIFGFILADGHIHYGNKNYLQFELASYDKDILEKIKSILQYEGPISYSKRNTCKLQINNKKIISDIIDLGMPSKDKTFNSVFPKSLPKKYIPDFIRGVFDGDGSIVYSNKRLYFQILGTKDLLKGIKDNLPIATNNISIYDRNRNGTNVFCLQVKNKKTLDIFDWLYKDASIYLDRKYNKYLNLKHISPCLEKSMQDTTLKPVLPKPLRLQ